MTSVYVVKLICYLVVPGLHSLYIILADVKTSTYVMRALTITAVAEPDDEKR
jgi:hypothetical protein